MTARCAYNQPTHMECGTAADENEPVSINLSHHEISLSILILFFFLVSLYTLLYRWLVFYNQKSMYRELYKPDARLFWKKVNSFTSSMHYGVHHSNSRSEFSMKLLICVIMSTSSWLGPLRWKHGLLRHARSYLPKLFFFRTIRVDTNIWHDN